MFPTIMSLLSLGVGLFSANIAFHQYHVRSKRTKLLELFSKTNEARAITVVHQMNDSEIEDVYEFLFVYGGLRDGKKKRMPEDLKLRLQIISEKYDIFT